jgi:hypothetical protein
MVDESPTRRLCVVVVAVVGLFIEGYWQKC